MPIIVVTTIIITMTRGAAAEDSEKPNLQDYAAVICPDGTRSTHVC